MEFAILLVEQWNIALAKKADTNRDVSGTPVEME
jgi:hypothetical protein